MCLLLAGCQEKGPTVTEMLDSGDYEAAIISMQKMIDKGENIGEAYRGIGIAYWELGEYQKARAAFEHALANGAKETGIICNFIGVCDLQLGHIQSAGQWFERGLAKEDNAPELTQEMEFNQIVVLEKAGNFEGAKEKLAIYVVKYPDDADAKKEADFLETR